MEGGAPSVTHYSVAERLNDYTVINLVLETGRTHQIRVHMSHIGHPIAGDHLYGGLNDAVIKRQALHAARLSFIHPISGKDVTFTAPLPDDMKAAILKCRK